MERFGDMFPGADTLDELLEQLAARMAAAEAMWRSLSPEQRDQLRALAESLLEDMDLRWQVDRLSANLQRAFPEAGWGQALPLLGRRPDRALRSHRHGGPAGRARPDGGRPAVGLLARRPLGDRPRRGRPPPGRRRGALARAAGRPGPRADGGRAHRAARAAGPSSPPRGCAGWASGRSATSSPRWPPTAWASTRPAGRGPATTARRRPSPTSTATPSTSTSPRPCTTPSAAAGAGIPVRLAPEDFEVVETEALTRSATVLLVDLSMSMPMRDNFVPAKKMAMALHTLISSRFPRDYLGIVGFSRGGPGDQARGPAHRHVGLRLRHQPPARAAPGPQTAGPPARDQADHRGDRRRADRPHRRRWGGLLQLPADGRDPAAHDGRGGALHQGRHHHQRLRPRSRADPVPLRRADRRASTAVAPSTPRPTPSAATCWSTSCATGA